MAIYTYRLGAIYAAAAGTYTLYQLTANQHVVVRDLVYENDGATPSTVLIWIASAAARFYLLVATAVPSSTTVHWDGRQELRQNDQLVVFSNASIFSTTATGYVFNL